jgi:hypothetical protein
MATISDNVNHSPEDDLQKGENILMSPDDESIWKRYNQNYEFPLSIATSVVLHVFVCLMVAIAGVWLFNFGSGSPPDLEAIEFGGGGGAGEGGGNPQGEEKLQDAVSLNKEDMPAEEPPIKIDSDILTLDDPNKRLLQEVKETDQDLARGINDPNLLAGDRGHGGPGRGGGRGSGFGTGDGDGVGPGRGNARTRRKDRWEISLPMQDSAQFIRKLGELESILMIPDGPGKFKLFDLTQKNPEGKPATIVDINKMNRIWYTNRVQIVCQGIADELGLSARPEFFAIFIPQTLEQEMFKKELAYRGLTEEELDRRKMVTKFEVNKRGSGWDVRVRDQSPRPN